VVESEAISVKSSGLLQAMGDLAGARPYYEQALAINREVLGEKHPNTALSLNTWGCCASQKVICLQRVNIYARRQGLLKLCLAQNIPTLKL